MHVILCKEAHRTSYSIASHISIFLSSELSNHTHFQLSQTISIFRHDVAHFVKFLPLKVIFYSCTY